MRPGTGRSSATPGAVLGVTTLSIVLGAFPIFLTGAMAVFIRPEMGFGETALGALATVYYLSSAVTTLPAGRLAELLGGRRAMALGASLSMVSMAAIAGLASNWAVLAALLALAGIGNGIAFPSSNLTLTREFPIRRQGVAFAVKQSAGPFATLVSGLAVPAIGLTIGWRWAFAAAAVAALPVIAGWRTDRKARGVRSGRRSDVPTRPMWVLAVAAFCGVNATASLGAFYVESAVAGRVTPATAGLLLSMGSATGIVARIGWGTLADRSPAHHFRLLTSVLVVGAVAYAAMGWVSSAPVLVGLTLVLFGTGWAWPSLLNMAVVRRVKAAPGIASGILGAGQYGGGVLGPATFGVLVERVSYRAAWSFTAVMVALAAVAAATGGRMLDAALGSEVVG